MRPYRADLELCAPMGDAPASMPGGVGTLTTYPLESRQNPHSRTPPNPSVATIDTLRPTQYSRDSPTDFREFYDNVSSDPFPAPGWTPGESLCIYAHRTARGHCHHRDPCGVAVARAGPGQDEGRHGPLSQ